MLMKKVLNRLISFKPRFESAREFRSNEPLTLGTSAILSITLINTQLIHQFVVVNLLGSLRIDDFMTTTTLGCVIGRVAVLKAIVTYDSLVKTTAQVRTR